MLEEKEGERGGEGGGEGREENVDGKEDIIEGFEY